MPGQIRLDILSLIPITYRHCMHCEEFFDQSGIGQPVRDQMAAEYPQDLLEEGEKLSSLVIELNNRYKGKIDIRIIDPQSFQGILMCLRHRVRKYPAFIINDKVKIIGWNQATLNGALEASGEAITSG